jgi:hypothetical protein
MSIVMSQLGRSLQSNFILIYQSNLLHVGSFCLTSIRSLPEKNRMLVSLLSESWEDDDKFWKRTVSVFFMKNSKNECVWDRGRIGWENLDRIEPAQNRYKSTKPVEAEEDWSTENFNKIKTVKIHWTNVDLLLRFQLCVKINHWYFRWIFEVWFQLCFWDQR